MKQAVQSLRKLFQQQNNALVCTTKIFNPSARLVQRAGTTKQGRQLRETSFLIFGTVLAHIRLKTEARKINFDKMLTNNKAYARIEFMEPEQIQTPEIETGRIPLVRRLGGMAVGAATGLFVALTSHAIVEHVAPPTSIRQAAGLTGAVLAGGAFTALGVTHKMNEPK